MNEASLPKRREFLGTIAAGGGNAFGSPDSDPR